MTSADQREQARGTVLLFEPFAFDMVGGVDVVVERVWRGLEEERPGSATIGVQDWHFQGDRTDDAGRRFLHLNFPAPPEGRDRLPLRYLASMIRRFNHQLRELRRLNVSVVNFHYPTLCVYPLAVLKKMGLWNGRMVLSFHGSDVLAVDPLSPRWRLIADQTDAVSACSAALTEKVTALGLFRVDVACIHNGIDPARFLHESDPAPIVAPPYVLNVGHFIPRKGQDILLDAISELAPRHSFFSVVCVGGPDNGEWLAKMKAKADSPTLRGRVTFLENLPQESVSALMKHALCLVHTARDEPFGLVLIEAAVCGAPLIATRVGGIPEIIPSVEYGWLIESGDAVGVARALDELLTQPAEAAFRASRLKERVTRHFSVDAMTKGYKALLALQYALPERQSPRNVSSANSSIKNQ